MIDSYKLIKAIEQQIEESKGDVSELLILKERILNNEFAVKVW